MILSRGRNEMNNNGIYILVFVAALAVLILIMMFPEGNHHFETWKKNITVTIKLTDSQRITSAMETCSHSAHIIRSHIQKGTEINNLLWNNNKKLAMFLTDDNVSKSHEIAILLTNKIINPTPDNDKTNSEIADLISPDGDCISRLDLARALERDDKIYEVAVLATDLDTTHHLFEYGMGLVNWKTRMISSISL
jgi:hypothetical protein